uniref:helix-turn-helix domain-containing protein n=1 Tax=Geomonas edaphica TaxID=2570226 RepID=UPI0018E0C001
MSQERLSELAGLHPTSLSDIERGKVNAALGTFRNLAEAMDVSLVDLVETFTDAMGGDAWREMQTLSQRIKKLEPKRRAVFIDAALKLLDKVESI